jgi:DivIVA domain-containing protein
MTWFFAFLVVAVVGAVVVAATGPGGGMAPVYDDRPDARIPADGPLTASDLREVRFSTAFRGYRMSEVDALLDRLAAEAPDTPAAGSGAAAPGAERGLAASGLATSGLAASDPDAPGQVLREGSDPAAPPRSAPGASPASGGSGERA